jgi:hypothetical protein
VEQQLKPFAFVRFAGRQLMRPLLRLRVGGFASGQGQVLAALRPPPHIPFLFRPGRPHPTSPLLLSPSRRTRQPDGTGHSPPGHSRSIISSHAHHYHASGRRVHHTLFRAGPHGQSRRFTTAQAASPRSRSPSHRPAGFPPSL